MSDTSLSPPYVRRKKLHRLKLTQSWTIGVVRFGRCLDFIQLKVSMTTSHLAGEGPQPWRSPCMLRDMCRHIESSQKLFEEGFSTARIGQGSPSPTSGRYHGGMWLRSTVQRLTLKFERAYMRSQSIGLEPQAVETACRRSIRSDRRPR